MNVDINVLPQEFLPRPVIRLRTLLMLGVIIALASVAYLLFDLKSNAEDQVSSMEQNIASANAEIEAFSSEQTLQEMTNEVNSLRNTVNQLTAHQGHYESFVASRVDWGDALRRVQSRVPSRVSITAMTQNGNNMLTIQGTAPSYSYVTDYLRILDSDPILVQDGIPSWTDGVFSLKISVVPGGEE